MLYTRQKELLYIINHMGSAGKTQLQKLEFLACVKSDKATYSFFPYKYGPYSLILQKDLDYLSTNGYINYQDEQYSCPTAEGMADKARKATLDKIILSYKGYTATSLMQSIYRTYPYYAINSERANELLSQNELQAVHSHIPDTDTPHLFTIGYEGRSIDEYLNILIQNGVNLLIDVRANGLSMKPEFSSKRLFGYCELTGTRYMHLPALGIASEQRKGVEDKSALFQEYLQELRMNKAREVVQIYNLTKQYPRVAFTCFERLPSQCHRSVLVDELNMRFGIKVGIQHL